MGELIANRSTCNSSSLLLHCRLVVRREMFPTVDGRIWRGKGGMTFGGAIARSDIMYRLENIHLSNRRGYLYVLTASKMRKLLLLYTHAACSNFGSSNSLN
jgi:hypothetical protein